MRHHLPNHGDVGIAIKASPEKRSGHPIDLGRVAEEPSAEDESLPARRIEIFSEVAEDDFIERFVAHEVVTEE